MKPEDILCEVNLTPVLFPFTSPKMSKCRFGYQTTLDTGHFSRFRIVHKGALLIARVLDRQPTESNRCFFKLTLFTFAHLPFRYRETVSFCETIHIGMYVQLVRQYEDGQSSHAEKTRHECHAVPNARDVEGDSVSELHPRSRALFEKSFLECVSMGTVL